MSSRWVATRLDMGIGALGTHEGILQIPHVIEGHTIRVKSVFTEKKLIAEKLKFLKTLGGRIIIKGLPKGGLTLSKLKEDLELLEVTQGFIPDVIAIDYADLMTPETSYTQYRHDLAAIYRGLREIALEKNALMITASQSNRASIGINLVSLKHFAEYSKTNIADIVLSLCQTESEEQQSIIRIFCCKNRSGVKGFQIENYYSFTIGQFSLYARLHRPDTEERGVMESTNF